MLQVTIFCDKFHGNFFVEKITNFPGNFLLKVAESPGYVRGVIRLHLSYCTMRTMFLLKELNFHFNQFCRGVRSKSQAEPRKKEKHQCFHKEKHASILCIFKCFIVWTRQTHLVQSIERFTQPFFCSHISGPIYETFCNSHHLFIFSLRAR